MGFLSKLFGSGPAKDEWMTISTHIAVGFEDVRRGWFKDCLEVLKKPTAGIDNQGAKFVNTSLGGEAELALKAYQLLLASGFIAEHSYIPRNHGKSFADLLYSQVCGTQIHPTLAYLQRYHEVSKDGGTQLFRFTRDISRYLTGNEAPVVEPMRLVRIVSDFVIPTRMIIAEAFGDKHTVQALLQSYSNRQNFTEMDKELEQLEKELGELGAGN